MSPRLLELLLSVDELKFQELKGLGAFPCTIVLVMFRARSRDFIACVRFSAIVPLSEGVTHARMTGLVPLWPQRSRKNAGAKTDDLENAISRIRDFDRIDGTGLCSTDGPACAANARSAYPRVCECQRAA